MSKNQKMKSYYKNLKILHEKDICILEKSIEDYRSETKANWKDFKRRMEMEMIRISKSLKTLKLHPNKKLLEEYLAGIIEPSVQLKKLSAKELILTDLSNSVPVSHH